MCSVSCCLIKKERKKIMGIIYFALGLVTALVLAEVVAWFSVVKTFNRYSEKITNIQMQNTELIQSTKEELQLLSLRIDNLETRIYRDIDEVHTRIGLDIDRVERGIDSRMDKFDLKLKKDLLKG